MRHASRLLVWCLGVAIAGPVSAAQVPSNIPELADMPAGTQRLAPVLLRFQADLDSVEHTHDITAGVDRENALRGFYRGWQARLAEFDSGDPRRWKTSSTTPCCNASWPIA